jgi:hypothetical protein
LTRTKAAAETGPRVANVPKDEFEPNKGDRPKSQDGGVPNFTRTPDPPSRTSPASRKMMPARSKARSILFIVLTRGTVAPRSRFLIVISDTPDAYARSTCVQPIRARGADLGGRDHSRTISGGDSWRKQLKYHSYILSAFA